MSYAEIVQRGIAMRAFIERVRERGDRAVVEEDEDLPVLRAMARAALAAERARATR